MRVALAYFGLARALRHTAPSIACQIEGKLADADIDVIRVGHFHRPDRLDNPRSGEHGAPPDVDAAGLLGLDACVIDPQDPALVADTLAACRRGRDVFGDDYRTLGNLCFQLRSLAECWRLASAGRSGADWVMFLRPDLEYLDPVDIPALIRVMAARGETVAVPGWQAWGGLNDRFALCRADAAPVYAGRAAMIGPMLAAYGFVHSEMLLAMAMQAAGLRPATLPHRALRIRADGHPAPQDLAFFAAQAVDGASRPGP